MKRALLEKLHADGMWMGPKGNLRSEIKYACQILGSQDFVGFFAPSVFKDYPEIGSSLFLGSPSELFQPEAGRDKVRDANGTLQIFSEPNKGILTKVKPETGVLLAYRLDHTRQSNIMIPSSFDDYDVQLVGAGIVGSEVGVQIVKMGLKRLTIFDPTSVSEKDLAVSGYRVIDPHRSRAYVAYELIADQTLIAPGIQLRYPKVEELGNVVINTSEDIKARRNLWDKVRGNAKVGLYIDVQVSGLRGRIFAINPQDKISVDLYEADLGSGVSTEDAIVYVVKVLASLVAGAFQRYVAVPGACIDRMYAVDMNTFYTSEGSWGKTR